MSDWLCCEYVTWFFISPMVSSLRDCPCDPRASLPRTSESRRTVASSGDPHPCALSPQDRGQRERERRRVGGVRARSRGKRDAARGDLLERHVASRANGATDKAVATGDA